MATPDDDRSSAPLARLLLALLLIGALASPALPVEAAWGILWIGSWPAVARAVAGLVALLTLWPASNRWLRETAARSIDRLSPAARTVLALVAFAGLAVSFWLARSRTLYGDGESTISILTDGSPPWNWKEPLDRFITTHVYLFLNARFGFPPGESIAAVSCTAGLIWLTAVVGFVRSVAKDLHHRLWIAAFLLSLGTMQLFFGNIENYSLLGAGILLYLWAGNAYLEGRVPFAVPCFVLAVTSWIHLSAPWLGPTLVVIFVLRVFGEPGPPDTPVRLHLREGWLVDGLRQGIGGVVAAAIPTGLALWLGSHLMGSATGLTITRFGGGDGKLWVPLTRIETPFEKFTMFSAAHFAATLNELLLIAGPAFLVCIAALASLRPARRMLRRDVIFLASCVFMTGCYIFFFNPDMAVLNVGILNEWDLFSLPAPPLAALAGVLLTQVEKDADRRGQIALPAVTIGALLAAAWILHNARLTG